MPYLSLIALVLFSPLTILGQRDCVLKKDKDSIKVYTCVSEHLKFKSIKSTFTVNARLSQLAAFVLDIDNLRDWQYQTVRANVLKKVSEQEVIYYSEIAAPWPVSNRDMIIDLRLSQDAKTKILTILANSVPQWTTEKDKLVRVPMSQCKWTVTPLSSSLLKVEYLILIDPGGAVPAWMVNMVSAEAPYESFRNLKDKINGPKFSDAKASFIQDY